jgi:hypothetical protein
MISFFVVIQNYANNKFVEQKPTLEMLEAFEIFCLITFKFSRRRRGMDSTLK